MRIRQIRPEFWTDEVIAALPDPVRLFYVGLWNVSDDGGYLQWRPAHIGALLYPYQPPSRRERNVIAWGRALEDVGRLVRFPDCDCAHIPTLERHQRIGGTRSFLVRDIHNLHTVHRNMDESIRNVTLGNVTLGNGRGADDAELRRAWRKQGLPVDGAP